MLEQREFIVAILALAVGGFAFFNRRNMSSVPNVRLLFASFAFLTASFICSVVESFLWSNVIGYLQHLLAPTSMLLLAVWSWMTFVRGSGAPV